MFESYPQPFKVGLLCLLIVCVCVCTCACVHVCTCHCAYMEVREQHGGASSLLIAHGPRDWDSGCRVWLVGMHTYPLGHLAGSKVGVFEASWPELASAHPTRWS